MIQCMPEDIVSCEALEASRTVAVPPLLAPLLEDYQDVFQDPSSLPLARGHFDHRIPLKEGTSPINLRPCRYPLKHKDVIEKLEQEMQNKGIIQLSSCLLYTSPSPRD